MYVFFLAVLLGLGVWTIRTGRRRSSRRRTLGGLALVLGTIAFFGFLDFWGEKLWFDAVGYTDRFWTIVWTKVGTGAVGCVLGLVGVLALTRSIPRERAAARRWAPLVGALAGGMIGVRAWDEVLLFANRSPTGVIDPILEHDSGFYLFSLPLIDQGFLLLVVTVATALVATALGTYAWLEDGRLVVRSPRGAERVSSAHIPVHSAVVAVVLAVGAVVGLWHLMYSEWGVVAGPGWTDVHVRAPAYRILAVATLALGAVPLVRARRSRAESEGARPRRSWWVARTWVAIAGAWFLGLFAVPSLVQWLVVEPNEITFEKPYIAYNIDFTRQGFRLHDVEERQFPASEELTEVLAAQNENLLSEVRLWDYRALASVYRQFQEIRLYYEFHDVDLDRYQLGDRYRQVMVSAREMQHANLPAQSRTFVNERFKYTHGYGLTLATVSDFTPEGLPNLLVKDIPPRSALPELRVDRPEIYYGELTSEAAVVNSTEAEFDYPSGDKNVYTHYAGSGGVALKSLWRKLVFGWKLDGTRFLLSSYPRADARIMFHREVRSRVATLAPFLEFDEDPYVVLADGRLYWIIDGYTTSRYYPYSEPFASREVIEYEGDHQDARELSSRVEQSMRGKNYVRNSVKAVVDAYEGSVKLYVFEPEDPLVRAWRGALPGLFRDRDEMPEELRAHVRYPVDFLLAQGLVYAKYHMSDPEVFYNQEDLWVRATEKYYAHVQPVEPYYVMWEQPGSDRAEFVLIQPFTPKKRQVLIGWIAGLCDGENYGRFLAYKFPKEKRVLGPQQVETKIDQDRFLSAQLTLWDQRGSHVIRGNVLAIPIGDTLLYVEPIYLQAETAAFPELRLVAVMHGDQLSYGDTFDEALRGLFTERASRVEEEGLPVRELATAANMAFDRYLEHTGARRFEEAAAELDALGSLLQRMARATTDAELPRKRTPER